MKKKGLIVVSNYYEDISENLVNGCEAILKKNNCQFDVKTVSGSLEIPTLISINIQKKKNIIFLLHLVALLKVKHHTLILLVMQLQNHY